MPMGAGHSADLAGAGPTVPCLCPRSRVCWPWLWARCATSYPWWWVASASAWPSATLSCCWTRCWAACCPSWYVAWSSGAPTRTALAPVSLQPWPHPSAHPPLPLCPGLALPSPSPEPLHCTSPDENRAPLQGSPDGFLSSPQSSGVPARRTVTSRVRLPRLHARDHTGREQQRAGHAAGNTPSLPQLLAGQAKGAGGAHGGPGTLGLPPSGGGPRRGFPVRDTQSGLTPALEELKQAGRGPKIYGTIT